MPRPLGSHINDEVFRLFSNDPIYSLYAPSTTTVHTSALRELVKYLISQGIVQTTQESLHHKIPGKAVIR